MATINMESRNTHLGLVILGKLVNMACLFLLLRASTYLLSAEELGRYYLLSSFVSLFYLVFVSPVGQYFFRMSNRWYLDGCLLNALDMYGRYILCVSLCTLPLAFILGCIVGLDEEFSVYDIVLMSYAYVLTYSWFYVVIPIMNMLQMRYIYSVFYIASSILMLLLPIFFMIFFEPTASHWLTGIVIAMGCMALLGVRSLRYRVQVNCMKSEAADCRLVVNFSEVVGFAFPVLWVTLFSWVQVYGFRMSLEYRLGIEYLAYIGLGLIIGSQILSMVESVGTQFFYPIFYRHIEECSTAEMKSSVSMLVNSLLPIYFLCAVYVTYFSREIFWLVSSKEYLEWHWVLKISIWAEFFRLSGNLLTNIAHAVKKTHRLIPSYSFSAIFLMVGVFFSSFWSEYLSFVVWVYFIGMLLFAFSMYFYMNNLIAITFSKNLYRKTLLLAIPLFFTGSVDTIDFSVEIRLLIAVVSGMYLAGSCFYVSFKWVKTNDNH